CTAIAVACANYFLQEPIYHFVNDNPVEYGDLICFAVLAVTAIQSHQRIGAAEGGLPISGPSCLIWELSSAARSVDLQSELLDDRCPLGDFRFDAAAENIR